MKEQICEKCGKDLSKLIEWEKEMHKVKHIREESQITLKQQIKKAKEYYDTFPEWKKDYYKRFS